jgi:exopolysaccharide production protein ExoQ
MLNKVLSAAVKPIAYTLVFFLTIRRVVGRGLLPLDTETFARTVHEMVLWILLTALFVWIAQREGVLNTLIQAWKKNWSLVLFIGFVLLSIVWSTNVYASIYKGIVVVGCSFIAAYTGVAFPKKSIFKGLGWLFAIMAVASFLLGAFVPTIGVHYGYPYYGAWRGIFWNKNYLGPFMVFGNLIFLYHIFNSGKRVFPLIGNSLLYLLTAGLVYLSKCATAAIMLIVANAGFLAAAAWVKWRKRLSKAHYLALAGGVVILLVIFLLNLNFFLGFLNRDTTLTGRFPLWSYLIQHGWNTSPLIGSGAGAAWETGDFRIEVGNVVGWDFPPLVADNGFVDMFLNLGAIGLGLFLVALFTAIFRTIKFAFQEKTMTSFMPAVLMAVITVGNLALSLFIELEALTWFLMVFVFFWATAASAEQVTVEEKTAHIHETIPSQGDA